jgi:hypothetical protein
MVRSMVLLGIAGAAYYSCVFAGGLFAPERADAATCENDRVSYHRPDACIIDWEHRPLRVPRLCPRGQGRSEQAGAWLARAGSH